MAKRRHGRLLREASLALEHRTPELVEALRALLARRHVVIVDALVDTVELAALLGVRQDLERLGHTLEERVVAKARRTDFLVGVVLEHLLAVCNLDLVGRGLVAARRQTQHGVVVERLPLLRVAFEKLGAFGLLANVVVQLIDLRIGGLMVSETLLHQRIVLFERVLVEAAAEVAQEAFAHGRQHSLVERHARCRGSSRLVVRRCRRQSKRQVHNSSHSEEDSS